VDTLHKLPNFLALMDNQFGYFNLGNNTHVVPMSMHQENRVKVMEEIRATFPDLNNAMVVLQGGKSSHRNDTDHEPLFRQESYFQYMFGVKEPNWFGVLDITSQKSYLFIEKLNPTYAWWMGTIHPPEHWKKVYEVDDCFYVDELSNKLETFGCNNILILHGLNTDSENIMEGASFPGIDKFTVDKDILFPILSQARVIKTQKEIELMRYVCKISAEAHVLVMKSAKAGMMEYEMESLFRHHVYSKGGCRQVGYSCICCSGNKGAILHYGHSSAPNSKAINKGEMLMFDMGGEYHCYTADISRSWPIDGKFTEDQRQIYQTVLDAQQAVMDSMKPGVCWREMHRLADRVICTRLKEFGFLIGDVGEMMDNFIPSLFFPHGLGHLLGLDCHDVGGYIDIRSKKKFSRKTLQSNPKTWP